MQFREIICMQIIPFLTQRLAMVGYVYKHGIPVSETIDHLTQKVVRSQDSIIVGIDYLLTRKLRYHPAVSLRLK